MSYSPKPRLAMDLDEIARQLNEPRPVAVHPTAPAGRGDPLAELARIVGQDDPYQKLLGPAPAQHAGRAQIQFPPASPSLHDERDDAAYEPHYTEDAYEDTYPSEEQEDLVPLEPRRSRKGLIAVAGVLGVAVVAVGGALVFGGGGGFIPAGEPPVIAAAEGPVKVQPQTPGGVEIPNQNKQIYERAASETQTRVVNREEQPVDVRQAVRAAAVSPEPLATTAAPTPAQNALVSSLGEPRRVRTVSIRPDGSSISDAAPSASVGAAAPAAPSATPTAAGQTPPAPPRGALPSLALPAGAAGPASSVPAGPHSPAPSAASAPAPAAPAPAPVAQPGPASPAPAAPSTVATPAPRPAATTPTAPPASPPQPSATPAPARVAAASPNAPMPITPGATAALSPAPAAAPSGGWAVQLGVRSSEGDARAAFAQFQAKYPELKGESPIIRQAEVNGSTIYRVRVGPLSKDEASSLCSKLQGSGGQCFVAKN
jgi:hypothetical protein